MPATKRLGRRLSPKPKNIDVGSIRVGDLIEVSWEKHGVTSSQRAYVGSIDRSRMETRVTAANERTVLVTYAGALITYPDPNTLVYLLRAAPETGIALFDEQ
jgi:hypothetical protein